MAWYLFNGSIPQGAVSGGQENGEPVYVCRAIYQRNWTPGKYLPSHNTCYIGLGGRTISIRDFEILVGR